MTFAQLELLYEKSQAREYNRFKLDAGMHGCKIEDSPVSLKEAIKSSNEQSAMLFRDPKDYEKLSDEEKAKLTLRMQTYWGNWAGGNQLSAQPGRTIVTKED